MQTQSSLNAQRFHGERVEARQAERNLGGRPKTFTEAIADFDRKPWDGTASHARVLNAAALKRFDDLFFTALLLDLITTSPDEEPAPQERIDLIDEANQPPLFQFWKKLNAGLVVAGKPEADYRTAKTAFEGGKTPEGSLTFVGKEWDGLRSVPTRELPKTYHGEFREVSDNGTIWRRVHNSTGAVEYCTAEAALHGAKSAREHSKSAH